MNYRFIAHKLINIHKRDLLLYRQTSQIFSRTVTTNAQSQLITPTHRWAIKRYVLLIGLPLTTFVTYRLSTKVETRRKHKIVLGSIGRAVR
jgi:hypothetical protein